MSAISESASGWGAKWSGAPLAFRPPGGLAESLAALGPLATARLRARQFIEALQGAGRKRRTGGGGPSEPPQEGATPFSYWDDPALWMLMMH